MADKNGGTGRRGPEKRIPPMGNNIIWYLLALALGTLLLVSLLGRSPVNLRYLDLLRLIEKGSGPDASIEVTEGTGSAERKVRYSDLSELTIGRDEITGKVTRQVIEPEHDRTDPEAKSFRSSRRGFGQDDTSLTKLLIDKGFGGAQGEEPPSVWQNYLTLFVLTAGILVLFIFVLRRMGGTGSAMAFGRSRGKLFAQEEIGVDFEDVAGVDEAVDELREVVEFLKTPEKYQILGGRVPKGVLLVGPPGTGKTLLAKAVAGEASVPFFSLSGSDFVEMFVGVGAARVRDMFQQAQSRAPCIVFIDELDALGKTRGTSIVGGHDEREQTLNALLVEMDGFSSNSGVIVMAATNRPETLDPALLRPGRFDRHVLVDRPDVRGREAILKVHVQEVKLDPAVNLKDVAAITSGFVGADLAALVNEAALLAAQEQEIGHHGGVQRRRGAGHRRAGETAAGDEP